jgi:hypothetical protein
MSDGAVVVEPVLEWTHRLTTLWRWHLGQIVTCSRVTLELQK